MGEMGRGGKIMKNFTRFENQYIMMLALQGKKDLSEQLAGQKGYIDPNIEFYIETLQIIAEKAKSNMKEHDEIEERNRSSKV